MLLGFQNRCPLQLTVLKLFNLDFEKRGQTMAGGGGSLARPYM